MIQVAVYSFTRASQEYCDVTRWRARCFLEGLDRTKRELEAQFPGWHIWYVPHLDRSVTWCAQPWPLINSQSPEHLTAEITEAGAEVADGALAGY
jgi:hypothetical protein